MAELADEPDDARAGVGVGRCVEVLGEADDGLGVLRGILLDEMADHGQGFGDEVVVLGGDLGEEEMQAVAGGGWGGLRAAANGADGGAGEDGGGGGEEVG